MQMTGLVLGLLLTMADVGEELPPELTPFVLPGHEALDFTEGDLDGDGRRDAVLILAGPAEVARTDDMETRRLLLLLIRQADGRLKEARRNDRVVYCRTCGGMMGDPYVGTEVAPGRFTVNHYGGSAWRWGNSYTFAYDTSRKDWFLDRETSTSFHASDPDEPKDEVLTRQQLGDIPLQAFAPAWYDKSQPWKVTAARAYFYERPDLKSKPRKTYVVKGDVVEVYRELRHFVDVSFKNATGDETRGYLRKTDLETTPDR